MMTKTTKTNKRQYEITLISGEKINLQAIPRNGYRLIATLESFPDPPPVPKQINYHRHTDSWIVDDDIGHPGYEYALDLHDERIRVMMARQQYFATLYVIEHGLSVDLTDEEWEYYHYEEFANSYEEAKMLWLLDRCEDQDEFLDILDAIMGINMPTEAGVREIMQSFQTMIIDNGVMIPLLEWQSEKERKGGMMMSLYAEGLMACAQLNGIISLRDYESLPGDPRYIDEESELPYSMSHIVAMNRANNTANNAVQEIEMADDNKNIEEKTKEEKEREWLERDRFSE